MQNSSNPKEGTVLNKRPGLSEDPSIDVPSPSLCHTLWRYFFHASPGQCILMPWRELAINTLSVLLWEWGRLLRLWLTRVHCFLYITGARKRPRRNVSYKEVTYSSFEGCWDFWWILNMIAKTTWKLPGTLSQPHSHSWTGSELQWNSQSSKQLPVFC